MPELSHIDPGSAALLVMDYQVDALTKFMTAAQSADAIRVRARSDRHGTRRGHDGDSCRCRIPARSSRGQPP
jgi:hypothetical protein